MSRLKYNWKEKPFSSLPSLGESPEAKQRLEQVVGQHDVLEIVGLSVLHEPWPGVLDDEDVQEADDGDWPDGGHKEKVIRPRHIQPLRNLHECEPVRITSDIFFPIGNLSVS